MARRQIYTLLAYQLLAVEAGPVAYSTPRESGMAADLSDDTQCRMKPLGHSRTSKVSLDPDRKPTAGIWRHRC